MTTHFVFSEENITNLQFSKSLIDSYKTQSFLKKINFLLFIIATISIVATYYKEYSFLIAGAIAFIGVSIEYFRVKKHCPIKENIDRDDYLSQQEVVRQCIETFKAAILNNEVPIKERDKELANKFANGFFTRDSELTLLIFFGISSRSQD